MAMAMVFKLLLNLAIFSSIFFSIVHSTPNTPVDMTWWCSKTPHPQQCMYYFQKDSYHNRFNPKHRSEFRKILVQLSMDRAIMARTGVFNLQSNCTNDRQRAALSDCLKLFDDTVQQLNRTLTGLDSNRVRPCSNFDAQTWLSTALTNIETCRVGSMDLNVTGFIAPVLTNDLTQLISNGLAVNGVMLQDKSNDENTTSSSFPSWVSREERKLVFSTSAKARANVIVAKDGSGRFNTIQAAIDDAGKRRDMDERYIIYVRRGVYRENIEVAVNNNNLMIVGDGMRSTIITSDRSVQGGFTTYSSATAGIEGLHFIAKDITFINTAGARNGQAVALRSSSDLSVFYRCAFQSYQDTLMVHSQRQFYRECYIYGTIDFIFGNAAVVFQNCIIMVKRPLKGQGNVITAQGRSDPYQSTGIVIHNSRIVPAPDLVPVMNSVETYMGRPWQPFSRTIVIKTYLDGFINPLGWSPWSRGSTAGLNTLYYGEYKNYGPASNTIFRVKWKGFHVMNDVVSASKFTVGNFIAGRTWLPDTGVPFVAGL